MLHNEIDGLINCIHEKISTNNTLHDVETFDGSLRKQNCKFVTNTRYVQVYLLSTIGD